jgi:hypothetical protein
MGTRVESNATNSFCYLHDGPSWSLPNACLVLAVSLRDNHDGTVEDEPSIWLECEQID